MPARSGRGYCPQFATGGGAESRLQVIHGRDYFVMRICSEIGRIASFLRELNGSRCRIAWNLRRLSVCKPLSQKAEPSPIPGLP